jgi:HAD superfamily hydrolase (TIGR01549 family)
VNLPGERAELVAEARKISAQVAPRLFEAGVNLIAGTAEVLTRLAAGGLTLAIVTSTPGENMAAKLRPLEASASLKLFEKIVTADDTMRKKPAPDPLLRCCRDLGIAPSSAVYVGDMRVDIQAGKAAGTGTVGVLTGFDDYETLRAQQPDAIIASVADLSPVLAAKSPGPRAASGRNAGR